MNTAFRKKRVSSLKLTVCDSVILVGGRGGRRDEIGGGVGAGGVNNLKAAFSLCIQPSRLLVHFERPKALSSL